MEFIPFQPPLPIMDMPFMPYMPLLKPPWFEKPPYGIWPAMPFIIMGLLGIMPSLDPSALFCSSVEASAAEGSTLLGTFCEALLARRSVSA